MRESAYARTEAARYTRQRRKRLMNKPRTTTFKPGDEISYSLASGVLYGTVTRVLGSGETSSIEIEFEDGRKEMKKATDRALNLLRRATGQSEIDEQKRDHRQVRDPEIQKLFRSEQRRRS
jgi:hypothetical protein